MRPDDDNALVLDMLVAARKASRYAGGLSLEAFYEEELVQEAVIRQVQIIGEAARHVSAAFCEAHPEIPWREITAMRHRLVHDYRRIDLDVVWQTATREAPSLVTLLEPLVPPEEPQ